MRDGSSLGEICIIDLKYFDEFMQSIQTTPPYNAPWKFIGRDLHHRCKKIQYKHWSVNVRACVCVYNVLIYFGDDLLINSLVPGRFQ